MTKELDGAALAAIRRQGLELPRSPFPGTPWQAKTPSEQHLLEQAQRLDRVRRLLLHELGRLNALVRHKPLKERLADAAREAERLADCPVPPAQLGVLAAAAAGELPEQTARRLHITYDAVRAHRKRAVDRLGARDITHAVAMCTAAGWITPQQIQEGPL